MGEFAAVVATSMLVTSSVFQFAGFFTPYWGCNVIGTVTDNSTCQLRGLYFTCPQPGDCYPDVLGDDILGMAVTSFLLTTGCLIFSLANLKSEKEPTLALTRPFLAGELMTGITFILVFRRFDVIGWSAVTFCAGGSLLLWTIVVTVAIFCVGACCSNDD